MTDAATKQDPGMQEAIDRLRAAKEEESAELYQKGKLAGREWAKQRATPAQLRRIDRLHEQLVHEAYHDWEWYFSEESTRDNAYGTDESLAFQILGMSEPYRPAAEDFWEGATGERNSPMTAEEEWLKGFAEGALELWKEVEDEI